MADTTIQLIIATFSDEAAAETAYRSLVKTAKDKQVVLENAALVKHGVDGKIDIYEEHEFTGKKGAGAGAVIGGVLGIIGGPLGIAMGAAVGAGLGGLAGKTIDTGISNEQLRYLGAAIAGGSAAIMALAAPESVEAVQAALTNGGATIATAEMQAQIVQQLAAAQRGGHDGMQEGLAEGLANQGKGTAVQSAGGAPSNW